MTYETEREQLDTEYRVAHAAALESVSAVVREFNRRKIRLLERHGIKNLAVELIEKGAVISHHQYPDGSSWYDVDEDSHDWSDEDRGIVEAISEAIELELIIPNENASNLYTTVYQLPQQEATP